MVSPGNFPAGGTAGRSALGGSPPRLLGRALNSVTERTVKYPSDGLVVIQSHTRENTLQVRLTRKTRTSNFVH